MDIKFILIIIYFLGVATKGISQDSDSNYPDQKGINFEQNLSWEQIRAKAKAENKYIFMDVFASWCGPCKRMDKEVYCSDTVGYYMNEKFVSIKVQMDTTNNDKEQVKNWYSDARKIMKEYKIQAYPSLLFFNPEGKLISKELGYNNIADFLNLTGKALRPLTTLYYSQLEKYKNAKRDFAITPALILYTKSLGENTLARELAGHFIDSVDRKELCTMQMILLVLDVARNKKLADSLAIIYKKTYLDTLSETEMCSRQTLNFVGSFTNLIDSKDIFFRLFRSHPEKIDSAMEYKGWADFIIKLVVTREEIANKIIKDGKPLSNNPNWDRIVFQVHKKYSDLDATFLVLDYKLKYYKLIKDWPKYTTVLIDRVEKYGAFGPTAETDANLNNIAWELFQYSTDKFELERALDWSDSAVTIVANGKDRYNLSNWMDTKANLLFKLGRVEEAIELENKVVALDPHNKDFDDNLKRMKLGQPTWPMK